jgi:hypothetical protein
MARIGSGGMSGGATAGAVARRLSAAAPWPETAKPRYRALFRERRVPAGRTYQGELTKVENNVDTGPREVCGLERRAVEAELRA